MGALTTNKAGFPLMAGSGSTFKRKLESEIPKEAQPFKPKAKATSHKDLTNPPLLNLLLRHAPFLEKTDDENNERDHQKQMDEPSQRIRTHQTKKPKNQ